jgi:hypothetical protein
LSSRRRERGATERERVKEESEEQVIILNEQIRIVNLIPPPISPTAVLETQGERLMVEEPKDNLGLGKEELESCISW